MLQQGTLISTSPHAVYIDHHASTSHCKHHEKAWLHDHNRHLPTHHIICCILECLQAVFPPWLPQTEWPSTVFTDCDCDFATVLDNKSALAYLHTLYAYRASALSAVRACHITLLSSFPFLCIHHVCKELHNPAHAYYIDARHQYDLVILPLYLIFPGAYYLSTDGSFFIYGVTDMESFLFDDADEASSDLIIPVFVAASFWKVAVSSSWWRKPRHADLRASMGNEIAEPGSTSFIHTPSTFIFATGVYSWQ